MTSDFKKEERIVSQKLIDQLFSGNGSQSLAAFPIRVVYLVKERTCETDPAAQLLISVSKRRFKHAVDRNRVKRQLREAWRHNRQLLTQFVPAGQVVCLAMLWLSDCHCASSDIEKRMQGLLTRIAKKVSE